MITMQPTPIAASMQQPPGKLPVKFAGEGLYGNPGSDDYRPAGNPSGNPHPSNQNPPPGPGRRVPKWAVALGAMGLLVGGIKGAPVAWDYSKEAAKDAARNYASDAVSERVDRATDYIDERVSDAGETVGNVVGPGETRYMDNYTLSGVPVSGTILKDGGQSGFTAVVNTDWNSLERVIENTSEQGGELVFDNGCRLEGLRGGLVSEVRTIDAFTATLKNPETGNSQPVYVEVLLNESQLDAEENPLVVLTIYSPNRIDEDEKIQDSQCVDDRLRDAGSTVQEKASDLWDALPFTNRD